MRTNILRILSSIVRTGPGLASFERHASSSSSVSACNSDQFSGSLSFDCLGINALLKSPSAFDSQKWYGASIQGRISSSLKSAVNDFQLHKDHVVAIDLAKWKMLRMHGSRRHVVPEAVSILDVRKDWKDLKFLQEDKRTSEYDSESLIFYADSVRRKRKRKMNKHKHAKRRKLNRHRR